VEAVESLVARARRALAQMFEENGDD
jgi:hypothetical protein